jgi:hypothetical protein
MVSKCPHQTTKRFALLLVGFVLIAGGAGCSGDGDNIFEGVVERFTPPTPTQAAGRMFDVYDPDVRRRNIALISASPFGGEQAYVKAYRLLIDDEDPTVRAACVHALGMHGTADDALIIMPLLNDEAAFTRWQAAVALQRIHHPEAITPLIRAVSDDEDADVRLAAATSLGQYAESAVFDALVGALNDRDFSVVDATGRALQVLTGQALGTDSSDWLHWSKSNRGQLFAGKLPYAYQPYDKPPSVLNKMQFWKKTKPAASRQPVGARNDDALTSKS